MARQVIHSAMVSAYGDAAINIQSHVNHFNELVGKPIFDYSNWIGWWPGTWPQDFSIMLGSGPQGLLPFYQSGLLKSLTISWMPLTGDPWGSTDQQTLKDIATGLWDTYIATCAVQCMAFGYPIRIRFGGEMNIHQGAGWAGNPPDFVAAWKRVVDIFRAQGVTNMIWIWNPNWADAVGGQYHWADYYPGDNYVDWVGIDIYQFRDNADPDAMIAPIYADYAARKPIAIDEWAPNSFDWTGVDTPDSEQTRFINDFFNSVEARPSIKQIGYFYWGHFKLDTFPLALAAYRARIANPLYISEYTTAIHILSITSNMSGVPFTINGVQNTTSFSEILTEGAYTIVFPSNVTVGSDTYNFSQWEDGSTNPQRMFPLTADATIMAIYVLVQPPPAKGSIEVHAFLESTEIVTSGLIVETGQTFQTPTIIIVDPSTYMVRVTVGTQVKEQWATITENQTVRLDFQFTTPPPISPISPGLILGGLIIGGVILSSTPK